MPLPGLCRALAAGVAVCLRLHKCGLRTLADTFDVFGRTLLPKVVEHPDMARRLRDGESPSASYALNPSPRMPSGFTEDAAFCAACRVAFAACSASTSACLIDS